jgi:hypothetical protein
VRRLQLANDPTLRQFRFQVEYGTDVYAEQRGLVQPQLEVGACVATEEAALTAAQNEAAALRAARPQENRRADLPTGP